MQKSKLIGVGIPYDQVDVATSKAGYAPASCPFFHLGVPVGQNMTRISAWSSVVDRFRSKLSGWKAKSLSSGGRLLLIKYVLGSLGNYLMSIFMVPTSVLYTLESLRARFF